MDPRHFISMNWWGKLIGAFLGYLIAGSVGALIGIFIGNLFDKEFGRYYSRPHWHYHVEKRKEIQHLFFEATFKLLGCFAKADGRVSEREIAMAKTLMNEFGLNKAQQTIAKQYFNEGKQPYFNLENMLVKLRTALHNQPELMKLFIDIQYRAANIDGLSIKKQEILNTILVSMGFASLHKQYRFYEDFSNKNSSYQSSRQQERQSAPPPRNSLEHAYAILNIPPNSSKADTKKAYRRLMSLNHPDKLVSKGLPEQMIKIANEKTQAISKAYEQICRSRGW